MLNYKKYGDAQECLFILHGLFGSLDNWQSLAQKFAEHFTVYIVDQRNHGKSPHFTEHNYPAMAADLKELMEQLEVESAIILGHSMGGKTVMQFSVDFPQMVQKMIVADISPRYYAPHHQSILKALHDVDFESLSSRKEVEESIKKNIPEPGVAQFLLKGLTWDTKTKMKWKFNLNTISDQIDNIGEALTGYAYFTNPVLFLKGENSDYIQEEDEELIEEIFPMSEVVEVANAGHWLHAENPTDFYKEVITFLK